MVPKLQSIRIHKLGVCLQTHPKTHQNVHLEFEWCAGSPSIPPSTSSIRETCQELKDRCGMRYSTFRSFFVWKSWLLTFHLSGFCRKVSRAFLPRPLHQICSPEAHSLNSKALSKTTLTVSSEASELLLRHLSSVAMTKKTRNLLRTHSMVT